jgi:hypothetical protein
MRSALSSMPEGWTKMSEGVGSPPPRVRSSGARPGRGVIARTGHVVGPYGSRS